MWVQALVSPISWPYWASLNKTTGRCNMNFHITMFSWKWACRSSVNEESETLKGRVWPDLIAAKADLEPEIIYLPFRICPSTPCHLHGKLETLPPSFQGYPEGTEFEEEIYMSNDADSKQAESSWNPGVRFEGQHGEPRCLPGRGTWNEKSANKVEETALSGPEKLNGKSEGW